MLRVTESMLFDQVTNSIRGAQKRAYDAQTVAQTGLRVNRLSDDPLAASRANILSSTLERLSGMETVANRATEELTVAESVLGEATTLYSRAREIAIKGANASMGEDSRAALAGEIDGLREQLLSLGNSRVADVYVFGGYQNTDEPFDAQGGYLGDNGVREGEIAPGTTIAMNVPGNQAFTGAVDVFKALEDLSQSLKDNDGDAVSKQLTTLEDGFLQLNNARGRTGVYLGHLRSGEALRYQVESSALVHRTEAVEADINEAFNELAHTQFSLQSAIAQAQSILQGLKNGLR